ncbi:MAG: sulfatase-like hydrolase/transferase, partial [Alistipes sp.]
MKQNLLRATLPALPLLSAGCAGKAHAPLPAQARPNVVFIFADDLGIGDLSCYGATRIATPNIDRLASEGTRFTNAYSTSATSTPSRFGLLTGMYPWRLPNTQIAPGNSELIIDPKSYTLADAMHDAGYATGAVGKWHLGLGPEGGTDFNVEIRPDARDLGFDYEYLIPATVDRVPCVFIENGRVAGLDPNDPITVDYKHKVGDWPTGAENPELLRLRPSHGHDNTIVNGISRIGWMTGGKSALWIDEGIADTIALKAKQFIVRHKDEPFFLYMGTNDVHVPRIPHPRFEGRSGLGARGDVILQLDWTVGEIMHTLDSLGIADNTLL